MINKLRAHYSVGELCEVLELPRSSYYYGEKRQGRVDPMRERLKAKVVALHAASRGTAGSRTLSVITTEKNARAEWTRCESA